MLRAAYAMGVLWMGVGVGSAGVALGADPAEVEALIRQGVELRRVGKDPAAVPYFQKAYDLERSPRTAAQLGLVESALGYWLAAEKHLQEAVASPRHPWLVQHLEEIRGALNRVQSYISELDVVGGPDGAEILVNGRTAGTLPLSAPLRVAEGPVEVRLRAPGYVDGLVTAVVKGGGSQRVTLSLLPIATTPGQSRPQPGAETSSRGGFEPPLRDGGQPNIPPELAQGPSGSRTPAWLRPGAWAAASAAVAALAFGSYGLFQQNKQSNRFADYVRPGTTEKPCGSALEDRGGLQCQAYYEDARSAARIAVIGFTTAGVLSAAAVVGFLLSAERSPGEHYAAGGTPTVTIDASGAGATTLGWSLRF